MTEADHDLLIRISEQIAQMRSTLEFDRAAWNVRFAMQDTAMADMRKDLDSLRLSRATLYGVATAVSILSSFIQRVFWK
jgi:hypothetical protein